MNGTTAVTGAIAGVVSAVPAQRITNADCPDPTAAAEAAKMTGVHERRWVRAGQDARTLCTAAAQRLLQLLEWEPSSIDVLVYVTQTPVAAVPADAFVIAAQLGLPTRCLVLQVNWSCAGYVYGLLTAMRLADGAKRALLLVGDATSTIADPGDRATAPLFGDAGSATAIVGEPLLLQPFVVGSDGTGADRLCQGGRGFLHMDGAAVFNFTLKHVPQLVDDVLAHGEPDYLLFHQANAFMLQHLVRKAKLPGRFSADQIPTNVARFGNCSCASIPLLMCSELGPQLRRDPVPDETDAWFFPRRLALFGFGAGWAWAGAMIHCYRAMAVDLIEV